MFTTEFSGVISSQGRNVNPPTAEQGDESGSFSRLTCLFLLFFTEKGNGCAYSMFIAMLNLV